MFKCIGYPIFVFGFAALGAAYAAEPIVTKAETKHYRIELVIGGIERMYTKGEAAKLRPKDGEIMVRGQMAGMSMNGSDSMSADAMPGMPTAKAPMSAPEANTDDKDLRHLEAHIVSKATGKTVRDAKVEIGVENTTTQHQEMVPINVMYGVQEGVSDWHYGNNVPLSPGSYRVDVVANGEKASFDVTIQGPE